jgi:L-lactate dehydrogenase complex protein LldG
MTEIRQAEFIGKIKKALNRPESGTRSLKDIIQNKPDSDDIRLLEKIRSRDKEARLALLDRIIETGKLLNMVVIAEKETASIAASIAKIAAGKNSEWGDKKSVIAWDHPLVKSLELFTSLEPLNIPLYFPGTITGADWQAKFRRQAESALIGITSADYCIAETATMTMKSRVGQPRCVSLLPSIHIAVIRLEQILSNLKELYTLLKWNLDEQAEGLTDCLTFITGPSKTADIEATLVQGAHGPRELYLFVLVD